MADKQEDWRDREARLTEGMRAERNAIAHDVSPSAGEELAEGSDARKAKQKEAQDGARKRDG